MVTPGQLEILQAVTTHRAANIPPSRAGVPACLRTDFVPKSARLLRFIFLRKKIRHQTQLRPVDNGKPVAHRIFLLDGLTKAIPKSTTGAAHFLPNRFLPACDQSRWGRFESRRMSGCRRRTAPPVSREHVGAVLAGPTPASPDATGPGACVPFLGRSSPTLFVFESSLCGRRPQSGLILAVLRHAPGGAKADNRGDLREIG